MRVVHFVAVAVACSLVTGCSEAVVDASTPTPLSSNSPSASVQQERLGDRADYLADLAAFYRLSNAPKVAIVREIAPEEQLAIRATCMTKASFPPKPGTDHEWQELAEAQADAFFLAMYTCDAAYPLAYKYRQPLSREQLEMVYAYYRGDLATCIHEQGHKTPEMPSLEQFLATAGTANEFNPYALVPPLEETVYEVCKTLPPSEDLYR